jgi:hypothetical protein
MILPPSYIGINAQGAAVYFHGPEATATLHIKVVMAAIRLLDKGVVPQAQWTKEDVLTLASNYTGKQYSWRGRERAHRDLANLWKKLDASVPRVRMLEPPKSNEDFDDGP